MISFQAFFLPIALLLYSFVESHSSGNNETAADLPDYLIVGAGSGGLQLALFLDKFNLSYSILEKQSVVGSFWTKFPRFEELISVNKWSHDKEIRGRYDWHSLLEAPLQMYGMVQDYFPKGHDWHRYMHRVAEESGVLAHIEFNVEVQKIDKNGRPCVRLRDGTERCARKRVFIGTGLKEKEEPLLRALGGVPYSQVSKDMAKDRKVCILGNGNSGFEVAQNVFDVAERVNLRGNKPFRLASVSKYSGDVRLKYTQILENYHFKLLDSVLHTQYPLRLGGLEEYLNSSQIDTVESVGMTAAWLEHYKCELFVITTGFQSNVPGDATVGPRFPKTNDWYLSVDNPSVHYIGWLMHERDFQKGAGGFLHGFRYLIRNLAYHTREVDQGIPYPHEVLSKEEVVNKVIKRFQNAADLVLLQDGKVIKDVIVPVVGTTEYHYYEGITYHFHQGLVDRKGTIFAYFQWGEGRSVNHVFDSNIRYNDTKNLVNLFLHPVVQVGNSTREIHEDPEQAWTERSYVAAIKRTITYALDEDLSLFEPKRSLSYERSVVNQSESYRFFERASPSYNVDEQVLQALWKAVYTGKPDQLEQLRLTAQERLSGLYRLPNDTRDEVVHSQEESSIEVKSTEESLHCVDVAKEDTFHLQANTSIIDQLNPSLFEDPAVLEDISTSLIEGDLVVVKNAFKIEFAEHVWQLIDTHQDWQMFDEQYDNGFSSFRRIPLNQDKTRFRQVVDVFEHPETKTFIGDLSKRNTGGKVVSYPTWFQPGDYSNPHNDHRGDRAVSMIWQLSKDWKPKWGGAFYWANTIGKDNAYRHSCFNTLVLFRVSAQSMHSVTPVTVNAQGKRLAFNTWFHADVAKDNISLANPIEDWYDTEEHRGTLTSLEEELILSLDVNSEEDRNRRLKLLGLQRAITHESGRAFQGDRIRVVNL